MKKRSLTILFTIFLSAGAVFAQSAWLDRPLSNWNNGNGVVPSAPRTFAPIPANCRSTIRTPESLADRAVTRAGWQLFGATQTYGQATVVSGMADTDGMCRPTLFNVFVFVGDRFAGTLSPTTMSTRTDGALSDAKLVNSSSIVAEFGRYTSNDPLCCPSQTSSVSYTITSGGRPSVRAENVTTQKACQQDGGVTTQDNVITGTVTYRQRIALPTTAVLLVKLVDVTRSETSGTVISEQRIETGVTQVPLNFEITYERSRIREQNRYAIQAEIRDGNRLLFITNTTYPVLTQGNPRNVEMVLVPVGGGGVGFGDRTIRGTVTYRERINIGRNSEITVRLVDAAVPNGTPAAETTVVTNGRQVPIDFELNYDQRDLNRQASYELWAEIRTDGVVRFKSARGQPVTVRGTQATAAVELVVVPSSGEIGEVITGRTLSLSKFGTGSLKIGDRETKFLIRGSVTVNSDGTATVTLSAFDGSTPFTGKLTYYDASTLRITVESSGDADASGEIEIKYSGTRLSSVSASNLMLDGQVVALRF